VTEAKHNMSTITKYGLLAAFLGTIIGANWTLNKYGLVDLPGPGTFIVPSGVYFAGLSFGLRDALHERDQRLVPFAIALGAVLSWKIDPTFAAASGVAFGLSEAADYAVYTPLRQRRWVAAVVLSNIVGSVVDSVLFLWLAFNTTTGWADLTLGKAAMTVPALAVVALARRQGR